MKKKFRSKVDQAILMLMKEKKMDEITVRDISDAIGYTPQGFYYHCRNLSEYFDLWLKGACGESQKLCTGVNRLFDAIQLFMENLRANGDVLRAAYASQYRHVMEDSLYDCVSMLVDTALNASFDASKPCPEEDREYIFAFLHGDIYGLLMNDMHAGLARDPAEIMRKYKSFRKIGPALMIRNLISRS